MPSEIRRHDMQLLSMPRRESGFSLIELAIALLVITLLAGGAISALKAQKAYSSIAEAREQIRNAREAVINYAIANQHLPCPANNEQGHEQPICPPQNPAKGFLPWQDLGLPAADPWGRPLHYHVSAAMTKTSPAAGYYTLGSLSIWSGTTNIDPAHAIAFAIWSTGEDGNDASAINPSGTPAIGNDDIVFEASTSDDIVEWVSRYVLFGRMTAAGRSLALTAASSSASSASGP